MMKRAWLGLGIALSTGCEPGARGVPGDAPTTDAESPDAAAGACDLTQPFGAPVPVAELATSALERTISLSPDELSAYFVAELAGDTRQELYTARRQNIAAMFGTPERLDTVMGASGLDFAPSISADQLTLLFASSRVVGEGYHLYVAARSSSLAELGQPELLGGVGSPTVTDTDTQPFLTADGQELWFVSDRGGGNAILRAPRNGSGFSDPVEVPEVSFAEGSQFPVVSSDRLTIFFASQRTDTGTQGGFDVWTSHRTSATASFATPSVVAGVSSSNNEEPAWISSDNCRLYLESDRAGTMDIYVATRPGIL